MRGLVPFRRDLRTPGAGGVTPRLSLDLDRWLDRWLDDPWFAAAEASAPRIHLELVETEDEVVVRAEVPGIAPEELDVNLTGDVLTLSGEKKAQTEKQEGARVASERTFGAFQRSIQLPCPVDPEHVSAEHQHGVVTITLRKADVVRPRRIQVHSK